MIPIYPFLAVAGEAIGQTLDKLNFTKNKIKPGELIFILFGTMVAGLLVSLLFIHQPFPSISLGVGMIVALMIAISFAQNFSQFKGLSTKNLSVSEPINNFEPILASFLAFILFPSEREVKYVVAIVIGSIILFLGHSNRKLKLKFDSGIAYLFAAMAFSAILANIYKLGLASISPIYLLLFRTAGVLGLSPLFLRLDVRGLAKNQVKFGVGAGLMHLMGNLTRLYSIKHLGLNFTILILLLGPSLVYVFSSFILKEKVLFRQVVTSVALLMIIILVNYL